ncbi:hypothetical protein E2562_037945 [Oryza meyeriana var. granulata]|uniref:Pentacotripeptide-repeat region of PRORP domain-containing protein n=1 Tax=Oryza meyeriana var. granulata TaxID=110450 RepID=A0A6G1EU03_9ORYZ|nr:hypothetical protein E2562_037945 [Oryza meyeriana var. granulata]
MIRTSSSATASASPSLASKLLPKCRSLAAVKQLHAHLLLSHPAHRSFPYNHFLSKLLSLFASASASASSSSSAITHSAAAADYVLLLLASHPAPTAFSYNVAIRFFASSRPCTSLRLFLLMLRSALRPDSYTLPFLLLAAARYPAPSLARGAHALLEKIGLKSHDHTVHSLITMYSYLDDPGAARRVFDGIPCRDVVSWNAMMKAYGRVGIAGEVGRMFRAMVKEGAVVPNAVTVAIVLAACRDEGDLVLGRWVEEWSRSAGMEKDSLVGSALVGMYEKCGEIVEAQRVFDSITDKDVVAWNAMITGYAQNGMSNEAISLFHCMRKAGIIPKIEHYSCMVDLLARSGHLEEAWDFIEKIPDKVDAVMLGALLAACQKCKNVEIGERVINRIIQLEPTNSWNYVVSSKIYASSDRLDDSAKMRGLMRERGVNKTPGCSWVEGTSRRHLNPGSGWAARGSLFQAGIDFVWANDASDVLPAPIIVDNFSCFERIAIRAKVNSTTRHPQNLTVEAGSLFFLISIDLLKDL